MTSSQERMQIAILKELIASKNLEILKKEKIKSNLDAEVKRLRVSNDDDHKVALFPATNTTQLEAAYIFPIEVWEAISQNLTASSDLINMHNTCNSFRTLLAPCRTLFLCKKVLPLILPQLDTSTALNCRKVCKFWKLDFDEYIETCFMRDDVSPVMTDSETVVGTLFSCINAIEKSYVFTNRPDAYLRPWNFVEMSSMHRDTEDNPFIGRGLELILYTKSHIATELGDAPDIDDREQLFWSQIGIILDEFGNHLTALQAPRSNATANADAQNISQLLYHDLICKLPNLSRLFFSGYFVKVPLGHVWPVVDNLPNITTLHIDVTGVPVYTVVRDAMQTHLPGLTRLLVTWEMWHNWGISTLNWSNLQELRLIDIHANIQTRLIGDAAYLPNLQELHLVPSRDNIRSAGVSFQKFMSIVAPAGLPSRSLLHTVRLCNGFQVAELKDATENLAFSNVANLVIHEINDENGYGPSRYNFLLHFIHLKTIKIAWPHDVYEEEQMRVIIVPVARRYSLQPEDILDINKIIANRATAYNASLWRMLPSLQLLCIQYSVFTRRMYENSVMQMS